MEFDVWKKTEDCLLFDQWHGVDVLFSLRGKEKAFLSRIAHQSEVVSIRQVHSTDVLAVQGPGDYCGDGLLTDRPGIWLTISVADCLPVYIYDPEKAIIGIIHAGKKGTKARILESALLSLRQRFDSKPENISILLGPSICPRCYDYDIWENNIEQAKQAGVTSIINPQACTAEHPSLFYSYRREKGTSGRMLAAMKLRG
jgi:YfiH family protein